MPRKRTFRKRGRPRKRAGSRVTTWVPASEHDRLIVAARAKGKSVSALLRDIIGRYDFSN